jgi:deazaflavin-dependent oxidoreductase (nitroreductase family)
MPLPNRLRYINKYFTNRLVGKIVHSSWGPFSIIYHVGRRSGKPYETPVTAVRTSAGFVVALTYGPDVDWYRNIKAAGRCNVLRRRRVYVIDKIEALTIEAALPYFPLLVRLILRGIRIHHYVMLNFQADQKSG